MTRRAKSTSYRPAPTATFIAVSAPKLSFHARIPWRRKLRAIIVAGGCALLAATAFAPDAAGQAQNQVSESRQLQGRARVSLQSLHPIVEQVLPAVVNVSVAIGGAEGGLLAPNPTFSTGAGRRRILGSGGEKRRVGSTMGFRISPVVETKYLFRRIVWRTFVPPCICARIDASRTARSTATGALSRASAAPAALHPQPVM